MRTIQILLNLISNAIKFSPENGKIDIQCQYRVTASGHSDVKIYVIDYGIGISEADQKRIFAPFFKT